MGLFSWVGNVLGLGDVEAEENFIENLSIFDSFVIWLWSLIPGQRSIDNIDKEIDEELCQCITKLYNSCNLADDKGVQDETPQQVSEQTTGCLLRSGVITSLSHESGSIDGHILFDICNAPNNVFVGARVTYLAYRPVYTEDWKVRKIIPTESQNDTWDGEENNQMESTFDVVESSPVDIMYRSELRQVTGRRGLKVTVNDGEFVFNLDSVESLFTPMVGDFLFLDAVVECDDNSTNLGGDILDVDRIRWVRYRVVTGTITIMLANGEGQIGQDVWFNRDSCKPGYVPCKGDLVTADAIESYQGKCSWRSLLLIPAQPTKTTARINTEAASLEIQHLCESKNGITINKGDLDFGMVPKGGLGKEITLEISNSSNKAHHILYGDFHMTRRNAQVFAVAPIDTTTLEPGESKQFTFGCRGDVIGFSKELFAFVFKDFKVGCFFSLEVHDSDAMCMVSQDSTGYWKGKKQATYKQTDRKFVVRGEQISYPPKFIINRTEPFFIPNRFWNAVLDSSHVLKTITDTKESLLKISPNLGSDLSFRNYRERFHSMLYLEEIDTMIKLQDYNMDTVSLLRCGPGKEFLSLEVPDLAEKRPSLLCGDKVLASRPWKDDRLIYEGIIHKTFSKSIWLKFNNEFHLGYNLEPVNVKFEVGRTSLRRQHVSIEIAMNNLGEHILFPTKLKLQSPQVELDEDSFDSKMKDGIFVEKPDAMKRHLVWINKTLNSYQKEAIRNVLKGEARPLPYIIFGPPGTGKTVTIVETILQLLFLRPDSRLLVATPSNSSANLITERLLDSNLLKPGDMVRLVSYHSLEEGSIPDRLRPFCTTGSIKCVTGEEAEAMPIGELKQSSNRETLGRHRITIGTCITLGTLVTMGFPRGHFTHVVVDEAGQATEPEIMVPLGFLDTTGQAILAGDPLQLGPVVGSSLASSYGLGESYLERLIHRFPYNRDVTGFPLTDGFNPRLVSRLVDNYRSLPEILALPNTLFYDSLLQPQISGVDSAEVVLLRLLGEYLPKRHEKLGPPPILFHGIVGKNLQDSDSPSWFNPHETLAAMKYLTMAYSCGLGPDDVGIITPYRKQVLKMRWFFARMEVKQPKIGSVEEFQGQERHVIIMSAVRSNPHLLDSDLLHSLGFVASPKRLNVAITRARTLLVILGNPHLLSLDPYWRSTIKYCIERDCYTGCDLPENCIQTEDN